MTEFRTVFISAGSENEAVEIAHALVQHQYAACCSIVGNVRSVYSWKGAIEDQPEFLLIAKTTTARYPELEQLVRSMHTYDVPEILCIPVLQGYPPYLQWLSGSVSGLENVPSAPGNEPDNV